MRRQRATVVLNRIDLELYADEDRREYQTEWTHSEQLTFDELGCTIEWGSDPYSSFVPWTSVLRIDRAPCNCVECSKA